MTQVVDSAVRDAAQAAGQAADAGGVRILALRELAELRAVCDLLQEIWQRAPGNPPMNVDLLRALTKIGNYVAGAYDGQTLVGTCVGFFHPPADAALHSHVTGVAEPARGRHVGFALKQHQRAWALAHGVTRISWTFDPLVRRNAYFNFHRLGATAREYIADFYGPMPDAVNRADESDRILVEWDLLSGAATDAARGRSRQVDVAELRAAGAVTGLSADPSGMPVPGRTDGRLVLVGVPAAFQDLRRDDPAAARVWRGAVRDVLGGLLRDGAAVVGFARDGWYLIKKV